MDYDEVLLKIGELGPYQKKVLALVFLPVIFNAFGGPVSNFFLGNQLHRCKIPDMENDTFVVQDDYHASLINRTIPMDSQGEYETCHVIINGTQQKCHEWVFDYSEFTNTIKSQFQAVCDRKLLASHATMTFYFGNMVSAVTMCPLSDIIGRRLTSCICLTFVFLANIIMPFSVNIYMMAAMRFLDGFFGMAFYQTTFVIGIEMVGPSKRQVTGTLILLVYCFGAFIMVLLAFFIRDWRWLQLTLALPMSITLLYWWPRILPESPRWLVSRGRIDEATVLLRKAAKGNKAELNFKRLLAKESVAKDIGIMNILKRLVSSRTLLTRWAIVFCNWFTISFIYYGIQLNIGQLSGDLHVNFLITMVAETLGYSLVLLINKIGRRRMHITTLFIMAVIFISSVFTMLFASKTIPVLTVALAMMGKLFVSLAFGVIYIYTGELFPTVVRNVSLGVSALGARIASLLTPYLYHLTEGEFKKVLPLILYAATILVVAILSCLLPETNKKKLLERIDDLDSETTEEIEIEQPFTPDTEKSATDT